MLAFLIDIPPVEMLVNVRFTASKIGNPTSTKRIIPITVKIR